MLAYRIELTEDDNGTYLVTCPALPEVTTFADTHSEALERASEAIQEALAARMAARQDIPATDDRSRLHNGDAIVAVPLLQTLKVRLYEAAKSEGVSPAELARRLDWHREQVDRLFRLDHLSRVDQIEAAFAAMHKRVDLSVRSDA